MAALLAVLVVGIDALLRRAAAGALARRLAPGLGHAPTVELPATWAGLALLRRRVARVLVRAQQVPVSDGTAALETLDAELTDVVVGWPRGTTHGPGTFVATLGPAAVAALTADTPVEVALDDGCVRLTGPLGAGVAADVTVEDGRLVVAPRTGLLGVVIGTRATLDLPDLPAGAVVTDVTLTPERATLRGTLSLRLDHGGP